MTKILSFISIVFVAQTSFAVGDFSGHWVAEFGEVTSQIGLNSQCSRVEIVIEQTADTIITKQYTSTCDLFGSSWGPVEQTIADGKILEHGEEVGTVDDTTLTSVAPSGSVAYIYNLKLVQAADGGTELESEYGAANFVGTLITSARLKRQ